MNIQTVHAHFTDKDPVIARILQSMPLKILESESDPATFFTHLTREIAGQQLSGKAADTIWGRFAKLFVDDIPTAQVILTLPDQALRDAGLSWAKVRSIKDLATKVDDQTIDLLSLAKRSNEDVVEALVQVKGIGRWTAEMFLMFTLGRPDVFSFGDLGLKKALLQLYGLQPDVSQADVLKIIAPWSPFRTYGCLALWHSLDNR